MGLLFNSTTQPAFYFTFTIHLEFWTRLPMYSGVDTYKKITLTRVEANQWLKAVKHVEIMGFARVAKKFYYPLFLFTSSKFQRRGLYDEFSRRYHLC